jgi:hypothetical protein
MPTATLIRAPDRLLCLFVCYCHSPFFSSLLHFFLSYSYSYSFLIIQYTGDIVAAFAGAAILDSSLNW